MLYVMKCHKTKKTKKLDPNRYVQVLNQPEEGFFRFMKRGITSS